MMILHRPVPKLAITMPAPKAEVVDHTELLCCSVMELLSSNLPASASQHAAQPEYDRRALIARNLRRIGESSDRAVLKARCIELAEKWSKPTARPTAHYLHSFWNRLLIGKRP